MSLDKNLLKKCKLLEEQDRGEWVSSKNLEDTKQKAQTKIKMEKRIKKVYFELVVNTIGIITPDSYFFDNINNKWNYDFNDDNIIKKLTERNFYNKIKEDSIVYNEAKRLKGLLSFFREIDKDIVPQNSILREFIGGSIFYKY